MVSSFSKQELERLHLTRSSFRQDDHKEQLEHRQSAQLFAEHLSDNSFHRNRLQQQQLVQQSFYPKMKKKHFQDLRSQLRKDQPEPAYSRLSLQQLTLSNLLLKSFQLTSAALLSAALVTFSLVIYKHKRFQLSLQQQLYLGKAQGGDLPNRAFPPACCRSLLRPALTLISLSFALAWLNPFSLAWRRRASRKPASTQQTSRRTTSSRPAWKRTALKTSSLSRTSFSTSSSNSFDLSFYNKNKELDKHNLAFNLFD